MAHEHHCRKDAQRPLACSLAITVFVLIAEVAGGLISNSLALLSDAGHVLTDAFALLLSLIALMIGRRPSDPTATFGYQRVGLLAALINGLSLIVIAAFIFVESYGRFIAPPGIDLRVMLPVAAFGLAANVVMAVLLGGHKDLNIKSAWLHVMGDTLSSIGVIASGLVIHFTGWLYADPLAGVLIGIVIVVGGLRVLKEAVSIFLEFAPKGFDVEHMAKSIAEMPEVMGIHDVHLWSLAHGRVAFSAHIWVHDQKLSETEGIRAEIEGRLRDAGVSHILLQFECAECEMNGLYCQIHEEGA